MSSATAFPENFKRTVPDGDDHERAVCADCGFIAYENPKIIAGAVITHEGRFLLCKRAIDPQKGRWTIPAGFLELAEAPSDGAVREAMEEATARIRIIDLLAVYSVRRISQVHLMYRAELAAFDGGGSARADIAPGIESLEVAFFAWEDIPWDQLAFPSVHWVLKHFRAVEGKSGFAPFTNPPGWENV